MKTETTLHVLSWYALPEVSELGLSPLCSSSHLRSAAFARSSHVRLRVPQGKSVPASPLALSSRVSSGAACTAAPKLRPRAAVSAATEWRACNKNTASMALRTSRSSFCSCPTDRVSATSSSLCPSASCPPSFFFLSLPHGQVPALPASPPLL